MVRPSARREAVELLRQRFDVSERRACRVVGQQRSTQRYEPKQLELPGLRETIREVAHEQPRYGYRRVHLEVQARGFEVGQRLVRRIYAQDGLSVRRRRRRRLKPVARRPMTMPTRPNERWSMDFVHDQLGDGRCFRVFGVIDDFTRESVALVAGVSLTSADAVVALARAVADRGRPNALVCDNGPEFTSSHFQKWAARFGIELQFIQPGKPMQNAIVESFNGRFRDECLNTHWFSSLAEARRVIAGWRAHYNERRPHSSLGNLSPFSFHQAWRQAA